MPYSLAPVTEIQAPGDAAECSRLRKVVLHLACATFADPSAAADVELAVGEAFSNAVKYGDDNSKVSVRLEPFSNRELAVEVAYPGGEFDTTIAYPVDTRSANGGFGRFIMARIMDGMEYSFDRGRIILRMLKRR